MKKNIYINQIIYSLFLSFCFQANAHDHTMTELEAHELEVYQEEFDFMPEALSLSSRGCQKASSTQLAAVNKGNSIRAQFQAECLKKTNSPKWCEEVERPNPSSKSTFFCTYGNNQPHLLIYPSAAQWKNAYKAIEVIQKLTAKGFCVSQIYNWWRPEPYNQNVGGAAGRHPFGTSVDVRFCTDSQAVKAFDELCKFRSRGEIKALGYYGSTGVHIGVGDKLANTWGRSCN